MWRDFYSGVRARNGPYSVNGILFLRALSASNTAMALTARSIDVNAPLRAVYDQWTRFEEFPLFMEG
jgi:hypothetical protein